MSSPLPNNASLDLQPADRLVPRPLEWLWPGRLALGKLAMLDGDPGLGKSFLGLDLCARLSTGRAWPDDRPGPGAAAGIVLNGEDGAEDTIRPRLQALGADLQGVYVVHRGGWLAREPLRFPAHAALLDRAVAETGARLVVIDPIMAFLGTDVANGSDPSVRRALFPLARLAEERRCAVLLVRHLNKGGGRRSVYRGGGSIGLIGACRSGWLVAADPQAAGRRVLAEVKNNLAEPQPSLAYAVRAADGAPAAVTWLGPSPWSADELLTAAAGKPVRVSERERACAFLLGALEAGPRTSRELWSLARREHLSKRTLRRAKDHLEIRSERVWADGRRLSYWLLPLQELPDGLTPESDTPELDAYLARLNEQYPPSTPLDDL